MPIYEYTCQDCNSQFERFVRSMTANVEIKCPECGGTHVKKDWSLFGTGATAGLASVVSSPPSSCNTGGT
jgi:putative FmdB family regulatory protein